MKKHKLYLTDAWGRFNGYDRRKVWVDPLSRSLHIGPTRVDLKEIVSAELRPLPKAGGTFLAIDVCGPSINDYEITTIMLIHKSFFGNTKTAPMQALVDELAPLIEDNVPLTRPSQVPEPAGTVQAQYALNVSLLVGLYRKLWYSYDEPSTIVAKTLMLMLIGGVANVLGVLLVAVPFDNYKMSRNLVRLGWKKAAALSAYVLTTCPAYAFWAFYIIRSATGRG